MRIDRLRIAAYRNLRSFEIDFDETQPTTVLLGRNGSGKSNLIEAIVEIFRELDKGQPTEFAYELVYQCSKHAVTIVCEPSRGSKRLAIEVDGAKLTVVQFRERSHELLPSHIFGYYSGWNPRLEKQFESPTRQYYRQLLNSPDTDVSLRKFFFCRKEYSQLALLAFFLSEDEESKMLLRKHLNIEGFDSALFVLRKPWWASNRKPRQGADFEPRLWNASGAFLPFARRLWDMSFAPIRHTEPVARPIPRDEEQTERVFLFIKDLIHLRSLRSEFESIKSIFGSLEALYLCDLIDEVRVVVRKKNGIRVRVSQLSEGEQQLLTVLGLMRFTQDDESLYLLDEPDTHLNPVWTYEFLNLLQGAIKKDNGHLIVATHNPLMIGTLRRNQVRTLSAHEDGIRACEPDQDPIGIGVEGLLKSDLYGLRSSLAPEVLLKLDRHYLLLGKIEKNDAEQAELMNLAVELNSLGVSRTHPNPYFEQFANSMAWHAPPVDQALSREQIDAQVKLVDDVLAEVLAEESEKEDRDAL